MPRLRTQMVMAQAAQASDADPSSARVPARNLSPQEAEALTKIEAVQRDTQKLDAEVCSRGTLLHAARSWFDKAREGPIFTIAIS